MYSSTQTLPIPAALKAKGGHGRPPDGRRRMRHKSKITMKGHGKGKPSPAKGVRYYADTLTRQEVLALVEECNCGASGLRDRALIVTLYRTGLRISEALGLRLHDIDLERGSLRVRGTKTRTSDRTVGIDKMTAAHLRDWLDVRAEIGIPTTGYVFCCISRHERGNQVKPAQARQKLKRLAEKAQISKRVHPHALRHTFASELANEHVDLRLIQRSLGHSNLAVTHTYLNHVAPFEVVEAMAMRQ